MMPLVLLVGFLGAGKTRFLTTLIPALRVHGLRVRVLLNDFENARIDASRLGELDALVTPLDGECVCCGSLPELLNALYDTPVELNTVMLIEANGATAADELLGYLTMDRRLAHFTLPVQLTVIDAARWQKRWWHNTLEASQLATATHVHLNWTARLSPSRLLAVRQSIHSANPRAQLTEAESFATTLKMLADTSQGSGSRPATFPTLEREADAESAHAHQYGHDHGHEHPFASATLALPTTVDRAEFLSLVGALPTSVVRAKGLVRFADQPDTMFVWNRIGGRKGVQLDKSKPHANAEPVALFIGVAMRMTGIAQSFGSLGSAANKSHI